MATNGKAESVLVVEDEILVAMDLEDVLSGLGHRVVETANRLDKALAIARKAPLDLAVLDVNLRGSTSYPVADVLRERGIPFLFATGYGSSGVAEEYRNETILNKPVSPMALERAIAEVLSRQRA